MKRIHVCSSGNAYKSASNEDPYMYDMVMRINYYLYQHEYRMHTKLHAQIILKLKFQWPSVFFCFGCWRRTFLLLHIPSACLLYMPNKRWIWIFDWTAKLFSHFLEILNKKSLCVLSMENEGVYKFQSVTGPIKRNLTNINSSYMSFISLLLSIWWWKISHLVCTTSGELSKTHFNVISIYKN